MSAMKVSPRRLWLATSLTVLGLAAVGCSDDNKHSEGADTTQPTQRIDASIPASQTANATPKDRASGANAADPNAPATAPVPSGAGGSLMLDLPASLPGEDLKTVAIHLVKKRDCAIVAALGTPDDADDTPLLVIEAGKGKKPRHIIVFHLFGCKANAELKTFPYDATKPLSVGDLEPGDYLVKVSLMDSKGDEKEKGEGKVKVEAGKAASVDITVSPVVDPNAPGSLAINIKRT